MIYICLLVQSLNPYLDVSQRSVSSLPCLSLPSQYKCLTSISGQIFGLFSSFSLIGGFEDFWMGSLHNIIQLMLQFLNGPFFILNFSYHKLMTFLMILSVILMLMILLSTLDVIRHLICGNNQNWLLNLNLFFDTL